MTNPDPSSTAIPTPDVEPGYCSYQVGTTIYIVTSGSISFAPRITAASGFLPMPDDYHLVVLADEVIVNGYLETKGHDVTIIARLIGTAEDTDPSVTPDHQRAAIDASGPDGTNGLDGNLDAAPQTAATGYDDNGNGNNGNNGNPGKAGTAGVDGGKIQIFCNSTQTGADLALRSTGGNGGSGQAGQVGQDGAPGRPASGDNSQNLTDPGNGGEGGVGSTGGDAAIGGAGGLLLFHALASSAVLPTPKTDDYKAGSTGTPGQGAVGGKGGAGGKGVGFTDWGTDQYEYLDDGKPGVYHDQEKASDGVVVGVPTGTTFTPSILCITTHQTPYGFTDDAFNALPWGDIDLLSYLEMELEQAGYDYLALPVDVDEASEDSAAAATVGVCVARLHWLLDLATAAQATTIATDPTTGPTASARLADIIQRGDALLGRITQGVDYFGRDPMWVPTLSMAYYEDQLGLSTGNPNGSLKVYADAEAKYATLKSALEAGANATETRRAVQALASTKESDTKTKIGTLQTQAATLLQRIEDQNAKLPGLHAALETAVGSWSAITKLGNNVLDLEKVLGCMGQFAFFPEGAAADVAFKQASMVIGQTGSAATSLSTPDAGTYTLNSMRALDDKAGSVNTAFTTATDGSFQIDGFNNQLMLSTRQSFDDFCDQNWSMPARDAKQAMDAWVDGVMARNLSIIQYNQALASIASEEANLAALTRLASMNADDQILAAKQGLAESTVQAAITLAAAREECIRLVYEASRALSLMTHLPDATFHSAMGLAAPSQIDAAAAKNAANNLVTNRRNLVDSKWPADHLPSETGDEETEFGRAGGVTFTIPADLVKGDAQGFDVLSQPDQERFLSSLKTGNALLKLDAVRLSLTPGSPFFGMFNVHLRAIRYWIHGFTVRDPQNIIHVQITHTGDSTYIADTQGTTDSRNHDALTRDFRYNAKVAGQTDDYRAIYDKSLSNVQDGIFEDATSQHGLLSPFATWQISLPSATNDGTGDDASTITGVRLEFFIDYDTVPADTVTIQVAEYDAGNQQLHVEATSSNLSATLQVYETSTNTLIGTLSDEGGGQYTGDFSWSTNPQSITVRSSLHGSTSGTVTLK